MKDAYKILYQGGEAEITAKKSRFIARTYPVESEEEADAFLAAVRKEFWDASHHCFAFTVGQNHEFTRCSDDGEPAQTAGRPILDVLLGGDFHNACVVVVRYFGGTLLGTGGLVRAYSGAAGAGLFASVAVEKRRAFQMEVAADYGVVGKIQYLLGQQGVTVLKSEYTDRVKLCLLVPAPDYGELEAQLTESTNGTAKLTKMDEVWYGLLNKEVILFEK